MIKILFIPDFHIGASRVDPWLFYEKVKKHIYPRLADADIIIFGGDFWDTLLHLDSEASKMAICLIGELVGYAERNNKLIRVLRGTFTHDRNQNRQFSGNAVVKIFDNITVEYLETFDKYFLYLPDEYPGDLLEAAKEAIHTTQTPRIDIVVRHGYWMHMLSPGIPKLPPNTLDINLFYKHIPHRVVLNGHVHKPSVYKSVISGGSFERMVHGEEEDKGVFLVTVDEDKVTQEFIVNTDAMIMSTFDGSLYPTVELAMPDYKRWLEKTVAKRTDLTGTMFIRIMAIPSVGEVLEEWTHSQVKNTIITCSSTEKKRQEINVVNTAIEELPEITPANIAELVFERARKRRSSITIQRVQEILSSTR